MAVGVQLGEIETGVTIGVVVARLVPAVFSILPGKTFDRARQIVRIYIVTLGDASVIQRLWVNITFERQAQRGHGVVASVEVQADQTRLQGFRLEGHGKLAACACGQRHGAVVGLLEIGGADTAQADAGQVDI